MEIVISEHIFKTKTEAKKFIREQLKAEEFNGGWKFWFDLFRRHPEYEEKCAGKSIKEIYRTHSALNGQPYLMAVREDNSAVDFSWHSCVDGKQKSPHENLLAAMRDAIETQVTKFKTENISNACPLCAAPMHWDGAHVDHVKSFIELAEWFLSQFQEQHIPKTFDDHPKNNRARFKKEDADFSLDWQNFHRRNAQLRVICADCNLTRK